MMCCDDCIHHYCIGIGDEIQTWCYLSESPCVDVCVDYDMEEE